MRLFCFCAAIGLLACAKEEASPNGDCVYHSDCEGLCVEGTCVATDEAPSDPNDALGSGGTLGEGGVSEPNDGASEGSNMDSSGGEMGDGSSDGTAGNDNPSMYSGPSCPLIGDRCYVACSWSVDCLLDASALSECSVDDRPLLLDLCGLACEESEQVAEAICQQDACSGAVELFRTSADVFNAACTDEASGEAGTAGSDANGGLGSNQPCFQNAQCASNICAVVTGGNRCAPASNACTPACADGRACVDVGANMGLCLETADANEDGSAGGLGMSDDNGASGAAGVDGFDGQGGMAGGGGAAGAAGADGFDGQDGMAGGGAADTRYERALELADSSDLACQADCERDVVCSPNESSPAVECQRQYCNAREYVEGLGEAGVTDSTIACYEAILSLYACLLDSSCEDFAMYYYGLDPSSVCTDEQLGTDNACNFDEGTESGSDGGSAGASDALDDDFSLLGEPALPTNDSGVQACGELIACFDTCPDGDQNCVSGCFDSNPRGGALYQSIIECAQAEGCVNLDSSIDQNCLNEECMPELEACFGPQAQPMGTLTCDEYLSCFQSCPDGDDQCKVDCLESTSQEGYGAYNTIISCLQDNNCFGADGNADTACLETNCQTEYDACFGPPAMPMGTASCDEFVLCFTSCPGGDRDCVNACIENVSPEAYDQYTVVIECGRANMCFDDTGTGDQACFLDNCAEELAPCLATPMGTGDCIALTTCLQSAADRAAEIACVEASSRTGYDDLLALRACIERATDASGLPCGDTACTESACPSETLACYSDGRIPAPQN